MTMQRDARMVKWSHVRLIVAGDKIEHYSYEKPYSYNWPPERRDHFGRATRETTPRLRRADNANELRRTVQRLINTNMNAWGERPKFVTFTFADNVRNVSSANAQWSRWLRVARQSFGNLRYVTVVEFQKRGAVHYHTIFFNMPYVSGLKTVLAKQWGVGFVKVKATTHVKDLGSYMAKYMTKEYMDVRLCGRKAYFSSRGLIKPTKLRDEVNVKEWQERNASAIVWDSATRAYVSARLGTILLKIGKKVCN